MNSKNMGLTVKYTAWWVFSFGVVFSCPNIEQSTQFSVPKFMHNRESSKFVLVMID